MLDVSSVADRRIDNAGCRRPGAGAGSLHPLPRLRRERRADGCRRGPGRRSLRGRRRLAPGRRTGGPGRPHVLRRAGGPRRPRLHGRDRDERERPEDRPEGPGVSPVLSSGTARHGRPRAGIGGPSSPDVLQLPDHAAHGGHRRDDTAAARRPDQRERAPAGRRECAGGPGRPRRRILVPEAVRGSVPISRLDQRRDGLLVPRRLSRGHHNTAGPAPVCR